MYHTQTNASILIQDSAGNDIAYLTQAGFGYQWFFENMGATFPTAGYFTAEPVDGTLSAAGDEVQLQLYTPETDEMCRDTDGFVACYSGVDPSAPVATFTAKLQNNGVRGSDFWYLESETSLSIADAHDDDPRDGYLHLFFDAGANRQNVTAYLVSAP